jgi:predicted nucleotidyltransferase component of viral defense system
MIGAADVRDRAREWSLREHVVEKDYVLGWFLWAIGTEPGLSASWVFKGGTCLKKCYFETYRFSEDLDFTVREEESLDADALRGIFSAIGERIYEASGIEVPRELIRFEAYTTRRGRRAVEGRVSYRGPLQPRGDLPRVKLDLTADEVLVQDPVARQVTHPFTDGLPADATVRCYSIAEVFAEKIRALSDRCLPRDLYDVVSIHRHPDLALEASSVYGILERKCAYKGIGVPTGRRRRAGARVGEHAPSSTARVTAARHLPRGASEPVRLADPARCSSTGAPGEEAGRSPPGSARAPARPNDGSERAGRPRLERAGDHRCLGCLVAG